MYEYYTQQEGLGFEAGRVDVQECTVQYSTVQYSTVLMLSSRFLLPQICKFQFENPSAFFTFFVESAQNSLTDRQ